MKFIKRLAYSVQMGWRYRKQLQQIYQNTPKLQLSHLAPEKLQQQGVEILVLDFDGVLAAHGEIFPTLECQTWLQRCVEVFGAAQIFILSNKPLPSRIKYFAENFAGVRCIAGVRKKPYPDGLQQVIALSGRAPPQILLADDRLLTGVLAGCIAEVQVSYITQPYIQLRRRPVQESFFTFLRVSERLFVNLYSFMEF
jgi:predicted HAD superfamily phosphohydrolase YqeG